MLPVLTTTSAEKTIMLSIHDVIRLQLMPAGYRTIFLALAATAADVAYACPTHTVDMYGGSVVDWSKTAQLERSGEATVTDPAITTWRINTTGALGHSTNAQIQSYVGSIPADVQVVGYNATSSYIRASDVPTHDVGPFAGNPAYPSNLNRTYRIPRAPVANNGTPTATGLGAIGVMVNGVQLFNGADAVSYNNQNVWHQNANVVEAASFDAAKGHPAPGMGGGMPPPGTLIAGAYHYHQSPTALLAQLDAGNNGQHHSPLIGFAFDGFPIYGPYGFDNADGSGAITRLDSSYQLRSITTRTSLANGTALAANRFGPAVSPAFPLGYYLEDYQYVAGLGELDAHNGRFMVTPEYPLGTYAYVATVGDNGAVYPYIVGPTYYGVVATDNFGAGLTMPAGLTIYTPAAPEPAGVAMAGIAVPLLARRIVRR